LWAKVEIFFSEDNGLVEALHSPDLLVPSEETKCKIAQRDIPPLWAKVEVLRPPKLRVPREEINRKPSQRPRPFRVPLWAQIECFSAEDGDLFRVIRPSKLSVAIIEMIWKANQKVRSLGVPGWAKLRCFTTKGDRLLDATPPPSFPKLGAERSCP